MKRNFPHIYRADQRGPSHRPLDETPGVSSPVLRIVQILVCLAIGAILATIAIWTF